MKQILWLVYDGDCPFCNATAKAIKIRQAVGELRILNAREPHPLVSEIKKAGLDLNTGMVLKFNDNLYHGADALNILALIGTRSDWFNYFNVLCFRSKILAKIIYPIFKVLRNLILKFKKTPPIQTHTENNTENLPVMLRNHYINRPYSCDVVTVKGEMNIYYSKFYALLMPLFKLAGMVCYRGKNIPTQVFYRSKINSAALYYERIFYFPDKRPFHVQSRMFKLKYNIVAELFRFGIGIKMQFFYDGEKIILQHKNYIWKIFNWFMPLPLNWLLGKMHLEEQALSDKLFSMQMTISHPWFGVLFSYGGEFEII